MITKNSTVAVLLGGPSSEAEISRHTGEAIVEALQSIGYHAVPVEYDPAHVIDQLHQAGADVVFIALHGKYGEDGTIQSVLELAGIPYTGSGVSSSAITMDKILTSRILKESGVRMAFSKPYYDHNNFEENLKDIEQSFTFPLVLKPACEGSTIGVEIVKSGDQLRDAFHRVFKVEPRILCEEFLDGREFTVSVLDGKALPVIEIRPHSGSYDFHSKYTAGATDYIVPAPIPKELSDEMAVMAQKGYKACECRGVVRFDMRTNHEGVPFVLEANSIPGMTATSLVPKAAKAAGISFPKLCERILLEAGLHKV